MFKTCAAGAATLILAAGAASAATLSFSAVTPTGALNPVAAAVTGDVKQNTHGSIEGVKRSPFQGGPAFDDLFAYTSVSGNGTATYAFGYDGTELTFIWGSPDDYNHIVFYNDGETEAIAISDYFGINLDDPFATITTAYAFDEVMLSSGTNAFEFAELSAAPQPVPLPAAGLLLLGGIGALGLRRRKSA